MAQLHENQKVGDFFLSPKALLDKIGLVSNRHYLKIKEKFVVKKCFFCSGETSTFQIDCTSGSWNCTNCKNFGNYEALKAYIYDEFGYTDIIPTLNKSTQQEKKPSSQTLTLNEYTKRYVSSLFTLDNPTLNWLAHNNKLTKDTIEHFKLGSDIQDGRYYTTIPYIDNKHNVTLLKYRLASDEKGAYRTFIDHETNKPCLYNQNNISKNAKEVFIVRSEMECWALYQLGWKDVVSMPQTEINSYRYLDAIKGMNCRINILYHAKYADKIKIKEIIDFLGKDRTCQSKLPQEIFDIFLTSTSEKAQDIISTAIENAEESSLVDFVDIKTAFAEVLIELAQPKSDINLNEGINTPWQTLNKKVFFRWGNLVAIGGYPGSGKTSFAFQWANYLTYKLCLPTLFVCLEMSKLEHVLKYTELSLGEHDLGSIDYTLEAQGLICQKERGVPLWIPRGVQERTADELLSLIEKAIIKYNLKVVMFDHLQFVTFSGSATRYKTDASLYNQFTTDLKFLTEKTGIIFICLSQLKKGDDRIVPTKQSLRETSGLLDTASQIILIYRRRKDEDTDRLDALSSITTMSEYSLISLEKIRLGGKPFKDFLKYKNGRLIDVPAECAEDIIEEKKALFPPSNKFIR
ncbi:MAG: DnaB-like helicase C-terminal domain-containing protein [bacterium]